MVIARAVTALRAEFDAKLRAILDATNETVDQIEAVGIDRERAITTLTNQLHDVRIDLRDRAQRLRRKLKLPLAMDRSNT